MFLLIWTKLWEMQELRWKEKEHSIKFVKINYVIIYKLVVRISLNLDTEV